jgi:hypothetical protein
MSAARPAQPAKLRVCVNFLGQKLACHEFVLWNTLAPGPFSARQRQKLLRRYDNLRRLKRQRRLLNSCRQPTRCSAERSLWPKSMPGCRLSAPSLARRWIVDGQICGFGVESYLLALRAAVAQSKSIRPPVFVFKDPLTRWIHGGNEILGRIAHLIAFGSAADFDDCGITR